jgi:glycine dehydrogenase subunit 2
MSELIFNRSRPGRRAGGLAPDSEESAADLPASCLRKSPPLLPEVSELDVVRHYTRLSQKNFSIDTHFYPLGSCTMKYNPRAANRLAMLEGFLSGHPLAPVRFKQGFLECVFELQEILQSVTGMSTVVLSPMAGAQGEFAGIAMMRRYHRSRGDAGRTEILVPDAAHGTNPASAIMGGFKVREIPTDREGDVDLGALKAAVGPATAGIMLTNPSTLGVFERRITDIATLVHGAGGLLYYDGANLNAILGRVRPGDMRFDILHLNLHKTFSTPHGGGGPGAAALGVSARLEPFLPIPFVGRDPTGGLRWIGEAERPDSIGRLSAFMGNAGVLLRAYAYTRLLGREGLRRVSAFAALNANYLARRLEAAGFELAFPRRRASHECIVTLRREAREYGVTAMDFAKRLLDHGMHAPTTYFPMLIPECLLIEPTETESRDTLDAFVEAMVQIRNEAVTDPGRVRAAPWTTPVRRLDDVRAAREPDLAWRPPGRELAPGA